MAIRQWLKTNADGTITVFVLGALRVFKLIRIKSCDPNQTQILRKVIK